MNHNQSSKLISFLFILSISFNLNLVDAFYGSSSPVVQLTPSNFKSKFNHHKWSSGWRPNSHMRDQVRIPLRAFVMARRYFLLCRTWKQSLYFRVGAGLSTSHLPIHRPRLGPYPRKTVVNSNSVVLVEFFAPWCGHCQALTPVWEKAATVLKGVATVAAIDADAHQAIAQEYGIKGFPTIKVFVPGKPPVDYQGAREAKPIAEFALKQVKALLKDRLSSKTTTSGSSEKPEPNASVELNAGNFDEMVVKSKDLWMVEFFAPWCGHCKKLAPEWKKAAKNLQGKVKLGHVNCDDEKSLMSRYKVQGFPTILMFGADKDSPVTYEGARSASAIESFALVQLETNVAPPEVNELTSADVMEEKCGSAAICFVAFLPDILDSKAEGRNKYIETLLSIAEKFKRSPYSYVWAAAGKQPELEKHVGVGGYGYPALIALNIKKGAYAPLRSAFERDQIIEFVKVAGLGGKGTLPLEGTPKVVITEPWDGKDGEIIEEDEFSLEELMGDSSPEKDEL